MLWFLVAAAVVVGSLAVLGLAGFSTFRQVRDLARDLGRASERVDEASSGLNEGLSRLQSAGPAVRPADGGQLSDRVRHGRAR